MSLLTTTTLTPQPPVAPEIEGYLKKLKRKTSNLSGSWNRRWFFVDPKRREFGYAKNKSPTAPKSSIFLNDITAVVQFDETHFQVESRTRNFFLCGESKAKTICWVKSLDEYRKKLHEYEKAHARHMALTATSESSTTASALSASSNITQPQPSALSLTSSSATRKTSPSGGAKKNQRHGNDDQPKRDLSFSSSSSHSSASSSKSSSKRTNSRKLDRENMRSDRREPSPTERSYFKEQNEHESHKAPERSKERDRRTRDQDWEDDQSDGDDNHEEERRREHSRERSKDRDRRSSTKGSSSRAGGGSSQIQSRHIDGHNMRAHPGHGYVMQAWGADEF